MRLLVLLILLTLACSGLSAQSVKTFDVTTSELSREAKSESKPAAKSEAPAPARTPRSADETDAMFKSMVEGFRSACCTFQEMRDTQCPCHDHQTVMLKFLISQGFTRTEVKDFMVNGGPPELRAEYVAYLKENGFGNRVDDFMRKRGNNDSSGFWKVGDILGPGYDQGWTEIILEAPEQGGMWILVIIIGLLIVGSFGAGFVILKRSKSDLNHDETSPKKEISDEERAAIEREIKQLDD